MSKQLSQKVVTEPSILTLLPLFDMISVIQGNSELIVSTIGSHCCPQPYQTFLYNPCVLRYYTLIILSIQIWPALVLVTSPSLTHLNLNQLFIFLKSDVCVWFARQCFYHSFIIMLLPTRYEKVIFQHNVQKCPKSLIWPKNSIQIGKTLVTLDLLCLKT